MLASPIFESKVAGGLLFEDLARFMRTLPPKSKQHIWEHALRYQNDAGQRQIYDETQNEKQINKLMCDWIIVYIKYLDRSKAPLQTKIVLPYVKDISQHIYEKYHPLQKDKFERDKTYFAEMVEDYAFTQKN